MKAFFIFLLTIVCSVQAVVAQQDYIRLRNAPSKLQKAFNKARFLASSGQLNDAALEFKKILKNEPDFIDAIIELGNIQNELGSYSEAEEQYENAISIDSSYMSSIYYSLGIVEFDQEKFDEAVGHFQWFLKTERSSSKRYIAARQYLNNATFASSALANPVPFQPINIGDSINTSEDEYLPSLTADGQILIFTAVRNNQEDFYRSKKTDNGWSKAKPINAVNTPYNEGAQSISADGKLLVFTGCNKPGGLGRCDLYYCEYRNKQWTQVRNIERPVNSAAYESLPSLSAEGNKLYFTSNRKGGYGGLDIWVSYRDIQGNWGEPVNLGPDINTEFDEQAPFIHPDGKTLYFMSKGHPGMGGFDLFISRKGEDGKWGKPVNLGYPINTKGNEGAFTVSLDGKTAFYASDKPGGMGKNDIYYFELYEQARPNAVTYVKAKVVDARNNLPLNAHVEITDLSNGKIVSSKNTDNGEFLSTLPIGQDYALNVSAEGYLFYSENFALKEILTHDSAFFITVPLIKIPESIQGPMESSKPVVLRNVFFETGSSELLPQSKIELNKLIQLLSEHSAQKIQINGHTDNVGSTENNNELSTLRARAVYRYLINNGISADRLQYKGFGESLPLATNDTEEGRRLNRRTEFQIIQ